VAVIGAGGIGVDVAHWLTHSEENLVQSKTSMIGKDLGRTSGLDAERAIEQGTRLAANA
jgi:hypothetical protein